MLVSLLIAELVAATAVAPACDPVRADQLVVIVTPKLQAPSGELFAFVRQGATWHTELARVPIFIGAAGLGVGRGAGPLQLTGVKKQEGDRRSPAGVFRLGAAFGTEVTPDKTALPIEPLDSLCIDDPRSAHYNQRLVPATVSKDWRSFEAHRSYQRAIVIEHNAERIVGAGSCIFLHDGMAPTPGCSAGATWLVDWLLGWLKPVACPTLVQLTRGDYERLRGKQGWPALPTRAETKGNVCPSTTY